MTRDLTRTQAAEGSVSWLILPLSSGAVCSCLGREVSLPTCTIFEDKLSRGASQLLRTPDLHRLHGSGALDVLSFASVLYGGLAHFLYMLLFDYSITL